MFPSSGEESETPTLIGPLERANLINSNLFLSSGEDLLEWANHNHSSDWD
jgi:hypothetical protein